jgi:UDPglucose 6-dehydrogenase
MDRPETIGVVGLWHLGSVVAASWAALGHRVIGIDRSVHVVARLRSGRAPIFEPELDPLIKAGVDQGRLSFTTDPGAVGAADVIFLAFDTPVDGDDRLDLSELDEAIRVAAPHLKDGAVVVVSSQVPVGTCDRWRSELRRDSRRSTFELVYSPENLRLGEALTCYLHPDRIVIGAEDATVLERVRVLFAPMKAPVVTMSLASAEMAKHALNSFLATSVSFINEIAALCEVTGADVLSVVEALKSDPRIGSRAFLSAGLGFAGGTLARDIQVLREVGRTGRAATPLLDGVLEVNRRRCGLVVQRLLDRCGKISGLSVGVLGLTYKAGTSTLRRSVALDVIKTLAGAAPSIRGPTSRNSTAPWPSRSLPVHTKPPAAPPRSSSSLSGRSSRSSTSIESVP